MRSWFIVLAAVGVNMSSAYADSPPPIEDAIQQATAAHKPLVVEFGAAWCGPCRAFEARTLPDTRVQAALQDVTFVRYDVDEDVGGRAALRFDVDAYPTFLVIDTKGVAITRKTGLLGPEQFIALLEQAKHDVMDEAQLRSWLERKPDDIATHVLLASWYESHDRAGDAAPVYERIATLRSATQQQRLVATRSLVRIRRVQQWKGHLAAEKAALIRAAPAEALDDDLLLATVGSSLPAAEKSALLGAVLDADGDIERVNDRVYIALAAGANDVALAAAERVVKKKRIARYLDTLAECHHARGDRERALELVDEAIGWSRYDEISSTLKANRLRFDLRDGDAPSVIQMRLRTADLWKRVEQIDKLVEHVDSPEQIEARRKMQLDMRTAMRAQHELAVAAAKACAGEAAGNDEALARVVIDRSGAITSAVLLLEPAATTALRDCLTKQLTGAKLSPDPFRTVVRLTVDFKHAH